MIGSKDIAKTKNIGQRDLNLFIGQKRFPPVVCLKGQILEQFGENLELMGQLVQQIQVKPVCISVRGPYYEPSFMGWGWVLGKWFMGPFMSLPTLGLLMYFFLFLFCTVTSQKSWKAWTKSKRRTQSRDSAISAPVSCKFMGYGWVLGKWFMGPFRSLPTLG